MPFRLWVRAPRSRVGCMGHRGLAQRGDCRQGVKASFPESSPWHHSSVAIGHWTSGGQRYARGAYSWSHAETTLLRARRPCALRRLDPRRRRGGAEGRHRVLDGAVRRHGGEPRRHADRRGLRRPANRSAVAVRQAPMRAARRTIRVRDAHAGAAQSDEGVRAHRRRGVETGRRRLGQVRHGNLECTSKTKDDNTVHGIELWGATVESGRAA